jgi:hypothetical protein
VIGPHESHLGMKLWLILPGLALIGVALHDLFHTLFHPAGRGALSDRVGRVVWFVFRRLSNVNRDYITLAGPVAILAIMLMWVLCTVIGYSFIYYPFIGAQFALAPGLDAARHHSYLDALNVSLGTLVTVGGDFNAKSKLIRLAMGIEATLGFGLLTASVSWLLSIYPALERRRTLAHEATLLHYAEEKTGLRIHQLPSSEAQDVIWGLAASMATARNDLTQFPIIYYFHSGDEQSGFSGALPYLAELAQAASHPTMPPSVRMSGIALGGALDDYLEFIAKTFIHMPHHDKGAIMKRYADEHLRPLMMLPRDPQRRAS